MSAAEFSHPINRKNLPADPVKLSASENERKALASRFGIIAITSLSATIALEEDGDKITASGRLRANIVQSCAVSGDDLPQRIDEEITLSFVPFREVDEEEVELTAEDCDEIAYEGDVFDLGEAVAQSLALAIDPFATGPDADRIREEKGLADEAPSGPFAALAKLKKD